MFTQLLVLVCCYISNSTGNEPNAKKILDAAENGDVEKVKQLFEESRDISMDTKKETAYIAADKNNLKMLEYIVEKDPSVVTREGDCQYTILRRAVEHGALDVVKYLVEQHNADIFHTYFFLDKRTCTGLSSIIHAAVEYGHLDVFKYFVEERNASVDTPIKGQLWSPLFIAFNKEHKDIIRYLIEERNADLTMVDDEGEHILYSAARRNDLDFMKYILDEKHARIDIDRRNKEGKTLLNAVLENQGQLNIVMYLVEEKNANITIGDLKGYVPLHHLVNGEMCTYLTDHGADVNQKSSTGDTPLHVVSYEYRELAVVRCLVEHGADVNIKNDEGETALFLAAFRRNMGTCKYLIEHGADVNLGDNTGRTPLYFAIGTDDGMDPLRPHDKLAKYLLENGANVDQKQDENGDAPLHRAVFMHAHQICKYLIEHGANINQKNHKGETPVFVAVISPQLDLLNYLVREAHADVNIPRESDKMTPLHNAASKNHYEICQCLIEAGADIRAKDAQGLTPSQKASDERVINLLQEKDSPAQ